MSTTELVERLQRELVALTKDEPWKTVALVRVRRGREWRFEFKRDLGRAIADPEFLGFCDLQTSQERLRQMVEEADA